MTGISNDLIVTFGTGEHRTITNNYQRNANKCHCWERQKTGSNFMQAIKGASVTIKYTGLPNILMVLSETRNSKDSVIQSGDRLLSL